MCNDEPMYDYEKLRQYVLKKKEREHISDKEMGRIFGVSERQIRKARIDGMDQWMADKFCVAIGLHPIELFPDEWLSPEGLFAADLKERKVTGDQIEDLARRKGWLR